ncbi:MAG: hypothetical protein EBR10_08985 [Planctomycetes bacterium]|nr:hypothetical protein [Planctomycetota bacterium]
MSGAASEQQPSLAHNCGAFVGHVLKAIQTPVTAATKVPDAHTVQAVMQERQVGDVTLRRIVIDQIVTAPQSNAHHSAAPDRNSP